MTTFMRNDKVRVKKNARDIPTNTKFISWSANMDHTENGIYKVLYISETDDGYTGYKLSNGCWYLPEWLELVSNALELEQSDGSSADYYKLPNKAKELQDLISYRDMNAQIGEIFRACYRYGLVKHSDKMRDAKKIKFYIEAEIERLKRLERN